MDKIPSFKVNHELLKQGIYESRVDFVMGEKVTTYDIRMLEPSTCESAGWHADYTLGAAFHTIEHWGATYYRCEVCSFKDDVIYFGPMGCLTGFYLILKGHHTIPEVWDETKTMLTRLTALLETKSIPGVSREECGRSTYHNLAAAKNLATHFLHVLNGKMDITRTHYPVGRVLFLCAMPEEADMLEKQESAFDKDICITGIGKVNAALSALEHIKRYKPNYVVSFGFAGGMPDAAKNTLVYANKVFYHDVWCGEPNELGQVQGYPQFFKCAECPDIDTFIERVYYNYNKGEKFVSARPIATGDSFVTYKTDAQKIFAIEPTTIGVDMEAAAIAQVCYDKKIPFLAYKIISDVIGSSNQWQDYNNSVSGNANSITAEQMKIKDVNLEN